MLIILATILCLATPTGRLSPNGSLIYLSIFRILLGIGVGADCPMSASASTDRATIRWRGTMLCYIFTSQGRGSFVGSIATIIIILCYKHAIQTDGETSKVDRGRYRLFCFLTPKANARRSLANYCWNLARSHFCQPLPTSHSSRSPPVQGITRARSRLRYRSRPREACSASRRE